ncbi:DUF4293 domain-containing protein [Salibacter sp.]|uniref:DUF4293 domain-containing protein n=1 Tax=Salibacter sp. TaxID=2010995 RepID=UPI002870871E|nr:DUF4293 domain-containing protein [Salibacter sp.]MDR9398643.1 DUF4293 domain-containing protein [Salibacter sp.]MDR9487890.1 DUF4293 domain-containing protein [Salibacter sp.]
MLQRIQTVFLFISIIVAIVGTFLPIFYATTPDKVYGVTAWDFSYESISHIGGWPVLILFILFIVMNGTTIFQFKNRTSQMMRIKASYLVLALTIVAQGVLWYFWKNDPQLDVIPGWSFIIPAMAFVFNVLAYRSIKKDDDLVKSVDRLR